jgi:hypothetical protein
LNSAAGFSLPITADCKASGGNALLTLAVGGAAGQPPARFTGAPMNFPEPEVGRQIGTITSPYTCTFQGDPFDVGVAVNGELPLTVSRFGAVDINDGSGALVIPAESVNKLIDQGHETVSGTVRTLNLVGDNTTPAEQNIIPDGGLPIPRTTLTRGTPITIALPQDGHVRVTPFKPTAGAKTITLALGSASAELLLDGTSQPATATCPAPDPKVILTEFPVT